MVIKTSTNSGYNTLIYSNYWEYFSETHLIKVFDTFPNSIFIFDCKQEYTAIISNFELILNAVKKNKITFILIVGTSLEPIPQVNSESKKYIKVVYHPTYWLDETYNQLILNYKNSQGNPKNASKLFTCFTNVARYHRCFLMDSIHKHGLQNHSYLTWNTLSKDYNREIKGKPYEFKYWKEEIILSKDNYTEFKHNWVLNNDYLNHSLFDLVSETTTEYMYFSEKTFRPILLKKPFIIYGKQGINKELIKYGFKIFNEIVDYSFDSIKDSRERADILCKELVRLSNLNYKELYSKTLKVVEHNYSRAMELLYKKHPSYVDMQKFVTQRFDFSKEHPYEDNYNIFVDDVTKPISTYFVV